MKKNSLMISGVAAVSVLIGVVFYSGYWKPREESIQKVNEVAIQVQPIAKELLNLYQERFDLMIQWQKVSGGKLPGEFSKIPDLKLETEADFRDFDSFQTKVTNHLSSLLSNPEIQKKIKDLERIEEKINKNRQKYHNSAIEADDLIQKFRTGQQKIPIFPAEAMLHERQGN